MLFLPSPFYLIFGLDGLGYDHRNRVPIFLTSQHVVQPPQKLIEPNHCEWDFHIEVLFLANIFFFFWDKIPRQQEMLSVNKRYGVYNIYLYMIFCNRSSMEQNGQVFTGHYLFKRRIRTIWPNVYVCLPSWIYRTILWRRYLFQQPCHNQIRFTRSYWIGRFWIKTTTYINQCYQWRD